MVKQSGWQWEAEKSSSPSGWALFPLDRCLLLKPLWWSLLFDSASTVQVQESPVFRRNGIDIHSDVFISVAQAVLGGSVTAQGLSETLTFAVSVQSGSRCLFKAGTSFPMSTILSSHTQIFTHTRPCIACMMSEALRFSYSYRYIMQQKFWMFSKAASTQTPTKGAEKATSATSLQGTKSPRRNWIIFWIKESRTRCLWTGGAIPRQSCGSALLLSALRLLKM